MVARESAVKTDTIMALVDGRSKTIGGLSWLLKGGRSGQSYPPVKYILS